MDTLGLPARLALGAMALGKARWLQSADEEEEDASVAKLGGTVDDDELVATDGGKVVLVAAVLVSVATAISTLANSQPDASLEAAAHRPGSAVSQPEGQHGAERLVRNEKLAGAHADGRRTRRAQLRLTNDASQRRLALAAEREALHARVTIIAHVELVSLETCLWRVIHCQPARVLEAARFCTGASDGAPAAGFV